MLRSLFSGVTGLKSHQTKMDVIGNNIANVNTYGFKSSRTTFRDVYYQTISSSTSASGTRSGSNASQVGYGTSVASVDILNSRTGYAATGNSMDLYIDGEGYFVVQDGAGNERLTQVGTFSFDGDGNLTDGNGNFVCGYSVDQLKSTVSVGGAKIDFGTKDGVKNGSMKVGDNYVSYLEGYTLKVEDGGAGAASAVEVDPTGKTITVTLAHENMTENGLYLAIKDTTAWTSTLNDPTGSVPSIAKNSDGTYVHLADVMDATIPITVVGVDSTVSDPKLGDPIKATTGKIAEEATFEGDASGEESLKKIINGYGEMKNIAVGMDGTITGEDVDGTIKIIGKIAIANVPNPDALQHEGNSYYKAVNNTGVITYTSPGESNTGVLRSGGLEMSNVDLANEFSDMIMTQRGFQANSKMITVSDEMLETLVNLKR